jgi:hypothetical protein
LLIFVDPAAEQLATVEDIAGTGVANIAVLLNDADEPEVQLPFPEVTYKRYRSSFLIPIPCSNCRTVGAKV